MQKIETRITHANGGMHNPRGFSQAKQMLETCKYKEARLYHIAFHGSNQKAPYQAARKSLCEKLRQHGCPCQWQSCVEADDNKGYHMHVYLLVEATSFNPDHILNRKKTEWLTQMVTKNDIEFHLNHPRDSMHWSADGSTKLYATLPKTKPEKLADCIQWISYLYKTRTKEGLKLVYSSSRPSKAKPT